jgi:hypothetical protein
METKITYQVLLSRGKPGLELQFVAIHKPEEEAIASHNGEILATIQRQKVRRDIRSV